MIVRRTTLIAWLALAPSALLATAARAALGGPESAVAADAAALGGVVDATPLQRYDLFEITAPGGLRVREFAMPGGRVFAVSWAGPVVPDLRLLLGEHYGAYRKAFAAVTRPGLERSLAIAQQGLAIEFDGHLRGYAGRAYLPALIPSGVPAGELR